MALSGVNFPNLPLPDLDYDSLPPADRALLLELFGEINHLRNEIRCVWDDIPYSPELDRFPICRIGHYFAIVEAGLVEIRILPDMGMLHGVYYHDVLARARNQDKRPGIRLTGNCEIARVRTLHFGGGVGREVFIDAPIGSYKMCFETFLDSLIQFRTTVKENMTSMRRFVKLTNTVTKVVRADPINHKMAANGRDKFLFGCIDQVTHLRIRIDRIALNLRDCLDFNICPAWGETAVAWEATDYNPETWQPSPSQVAWEPQNAGGNFKIYAWNTMGIENPALEECLQFVKAAVDPGMMIFTQVGKDVDDAIIHRITGIMEMAGWWICEREGGMWIVWNTNKLVVRFLQAADDGAHMVLTLPPGTDTTSPCLDLI